MLSNHNNRALEPGSIIGFDFGTKRIGVAVGQQLSKTASPLGFIAARDGIPNKEQLAAILDEWQPVAIVVGLPLNMDGSEQLLSHCAKRFANRLQAANQHRPVFLVDERLTTRAARSKIVHERGYRALAKQSVDAVAAQIILESWLNSR